MSDSSFASLELATQPGKLAMEVFTEFHRITGQVQTSTLRTNGVLNNSTPYLLLETVSTHSLMRLQDNPIESRVARLAKNSIVLAVPNEEAEGERLNHAGRRLSGFREMLQRRVLMVLGHFEVSGNLHLFEEQELPVLLDNKPEQFVALTDASITYLLNHSVRINTGVVLVNKQRLDFACAGTP